MEINSKTLKRAEKSDYARLKYFKSKSFTERTNTTLYIAATKPMADLWWRKKTIFYILPRTRPRRSRDSKIIIKKHVYKREKCREIL